MMSSKIIVFACLLAVSACDPNKQSPNVRIVGGHDAQPGQFPYQVSLQWKSPQDTKFKHYCSGIILNDSWILTAAHCIRSSKNKHRLSAFIVRAGKYNLSKVEPTEQTVYIHSNFTHENYEALGKYTHDISLIKLKTSLKLNEYVKAIRLPKKDSEPWGYVTLSGWGKIRNSDKNSHPEVLQTITLPIVDRKSCNRAIRSIFMERFKFKTDVVKQHTVCTGPLEGGQSACHGDSGGPIVSKNKNGKAEVVGIVSWGFVPCGRRGAPSMYTRVSSFIDWITDTIYKNDV